MSTPSLLCLGVELVSWYQECVECTWWWPLSKECSAVCRALLCDRPPPSTCSTSLIRKIIVRREVLMTPETWLLRAPKKQGSGRELRIYVSTYVRTYTDSTFIRSVRPDEVLVLFALAEAFAVWPKAGQGVWCNWARRPSLETASALRAGSFNKKLIVRLDLIKSC